MSHPIKYHIVYPLLDIVFPQPCPLCSQPVNTGSPTFPLCVPCNQGIALTWQEKAIRANTRLYSFGLYEGPLRTVIQQLKYEQVKPLAPYLAKKMAGLLPKSDIFDYNYLVPVPMHIQRTYQRTYNHTAYLAKCLSQYTHIPCAAYLLHKKKYTPSQTQQKGPERILNVIESFAAKKRRSVLNTGKLLLIDDVFTTGSTAGDCLRALHKVYPQITMDILTIAHT